MGEKQESHEGHVARRVSTGALTRGSALPLPQCALRVARVRETLCRSLSCMALLCAHVARFSRCREQKASGLSADGITNKGDPTSMQRTASSRARCRATRERSDQTRCISASSAHRRRSTSPAELHARQRGAEL